MCSLIIASMSSARVMFRCKSIIETHTPCCLYVLQLPDASMVLHLLGFKPLPVERYLEIGAPTSASVSTSAADAPTPSKQTKTKPPPSAPCSPSKARRLAIAAGPSSASPRRQLNPPSSSRNLASASDPLVQQSAAKDQDCPGTSSASVGVEAAAAAVQSSVSHVFETVGAYHNPKVLKALQLAQRSSTAQMVKSSGAT